MSRNAIKTSVARLRRVPKAEKTRPAEITVPVRKQNRGPLNKHFHANQISPL